MSSHNTRGHDDDGDDDKTFPDVEDEDSNEDDAITASEFREDLKTSNQSRKVSMSSGVRRGKRQVDQPEQTKVRSLVAH